MRGLENTKASLPETVVRCTECEFIGDKENTIMKQKNMMHRDQKKKSSDEHENIVNFFCDECHFCTKTRKSLKKHNGKYLTMEKASTLRQP